MVVQFGRQISQKFTTMHWASCKTIRHLNQNAGSSRISNSSLEVPCFDQSLKTSPHSESLGLSWVRTDRRSEFSLRQSYDTDRKWSAKLRSRLQNHEVLKTETQSWLGLQGSWNFSCAISRSRKAMCLDIDEWIDTNRRRSALSTLRSLRRCLVRHTGCFTSDWQHKSS